MAMIRFSYQTEALGGPPPPSLPTAATFRWRPLIPIKVIGPTGLYRDYGLTVLDSAADDTILPIDLVRT
jgi:hypothetical protein